MYTPVTILENGIDYELLILPPEIGVENVRENKSNANDKGDSGVDGGVEVFETNNPAQGYGDGCSECDPDTFYNWRG